MDYQLFDELERTLEERQSLLHFDKILTDMAPERGIQQMLTQIVADEEQSLIALQRLYHSFMKQDYTFEDRPNPQIVEFEDGVRARLLREITAEQEYGDQFARAVDATVRKLLFEQFCAATSRVQRLLYVFISTEKNNLRRSAGV